MRDLDTRIEKAIIRAKSQKWGDKGDFYEKDYHKRKRMKLRKYGR